MKLKTVLAAFAAMVTMGVNAQSWTGNEVAAGTFYLYNVGAGKYLNNGDPYESWGTNAYLQAGFGMDVVLAKISDGVYTIDTNVSNGGNDHYMNSSTWTDGAATNWTFQTVAGETNTYQIIFNGQYLMANEALNDVEMVANPGSRITSTYWKLVSEQDFKDAMVAKAYSATDPMDVSVFIKGRSFARNDGRNNTWVRTYQNASNQKWIEGVDNKYFGNEFWNQTFDIHQEITGLPDGTYEVQCSGFGTNGTTFVYGNTKEGALTTENSAAGGNRGTAYRLIADENAWAGQTTGTFTLSGGNLTVGLKRTINKSADWCVYDEFRLYYYGLDLSEFAATLAAAVEAAEAVEGTVPTAAYNALAAVVTENNKSYSTASDYTAAANAIVTATNTAKALQANYSRYNTVKTAALAISENVVTSETDTQVNAATTNDAINAAIATLRAAFLAELPNVTIPTDPGYIDVTSVMVDNAGVHTNTDYWTIEGTKNGGYSFGVCNYGECEFYNCNFKFYQTLALTPGTWEFGVTGFHRAGNHSTYFYAGEDKILIPGVANTVVNSMAEAQTYFDDGNGKVALKFLIETAGNVEIGIDNQDTQTDKWTIFRDFTLKYYGAPDYSIYDQQWNDAVTAANEALDAQAYKYVSGSERTAVTDAIDDAPDGSSKANYLEKIQALDAATAAFKAAAPSYNAYVLAKTAVQNLWGSNLGVAAPTTAAEAAAAATSGFNVAQYNKVASDYIYSLTGKIGEFSTWTKVATSGGAEDTPQTLSTEHFRGNGYTYYEQGKNGWAANSFTVDYSKIATLPAGNYVIKVATRASNNVTGTVSATATANTVAIANVGASSKGITTSGVASFDEGEFVNGGNGYGWQWRFLPFTVAEEGAVTITIHAESSSEHGWVSIADAELLSDADKSTKVNYDEAAVNTIEDVDVATVTITRAIKVGYNTVVLPFDLTASQVQAAFGTGTEVYAFSENSADPNDVTINFNKGDGSITANVPVLVKATAASPEQVFEGVQIVAPTDDVKVAGKNIDFVGVYAPSTVEENDYFIGNDAIFKSTGATNIKAFRAFLDNKTGGSEVKMFIGGIATGINEINGAIAAEDNAPVFNLAGQRVNKAQKGIYIQNGKKVLVK